VKASEWLKVEKGRLERLFRNGIWSSFGAGLGRLLNLVAMVLLARSLSVTDFGYFALIQSTLGVFAVFASAGLGVTATRFLAQCRHSDRARAGRILGLVWTTTLITTGIMFIAALGASGWIAKAVVDGSGVTIFAATFSVACIFFAVQTWRGIQDAILMGFERFRDVALLRIIEGAGVLVAMPLLAQFYGLMGAIYGQILAVGVVFLAGHLKIRRARIKHGVVLDWQGVRCEWPVLRDFSLPSLMSNIAGTPVLWFGVWFLALAPGGITQIAYYNAAYQWHGPLVFVPMALCSASMPIMVQAWAAGEMAQFRRLFFVVSGIAFCFGLLPALVLVLLREQIMGGYGAEYLAGQGALVLLLLAAPLHALANIGASALQCMERAWVVMRTTLLWGGCFVAATFLVVPDWGASGLAAALAFSYAVLALSRILYVPIVSRQLVSGS
jgi:O-antigen/teichoic acid export membrane protein